MSVEGIRDSLKRRGVRLTRQRQILLDLIDPGTPGGPTIRFFDFRRGTAAILFQAPKPFPHPFGGSSSQGIAITRDGRWIAYESEDRAEGRVMVMENFR